MNRRISRRSVDDDAITCAANFEAALEAYLDGGDAEELLRASALVLGPGIPPDGERADAGGKRNDALRGCKGVQGSIRCNQGNTRP
jgi:hypothetical protein